MQPQQTNNGLLMPVLQRFLAHCLLVVRVRDHKRGRGFNQFEPKRWNRHTSHAEIFFRTGNFEFFFVQESEQIQTTKQINGGIVFEVGELAEALIKLATGDSLAPGPGAVGEQGGRDAKGSATCAKLTGGRAAPRSRSDSVGQCWTARQVATNPHGSCYSGQPGRLGRPFFLKEKGSVWREYRDPPQALHKAHNAADWPVLVGRGEKNVDWEWVLPFGGGKSLLPMGGCAQARAANVQYGDEKPSEPPSSSRTQEPHGFLKPQRAALCRPPAVQTSG